MSEDKKELNKANFHDFVRHVKVAYKQTKRKGLMVWWLVGGVVLFLFLVMALPGGKPHKKPTEESARGHEQASAQSMTENVEKLMSIRHKYVGKNNGSKNYPGTETLNPGFPEKAIPQKYLGEKDLGKNNPSKKDPRIISPGIKYLSKNSQDKETIARQHAPTQLYQGPTLEEADNRNEGHQDARTQTMVSHDNRGVTARPMAGAESSIAMGELLHGVLETAINSDIPGQVRAVLTEPVFSYTGSQPLMQAGTRLVGEYANHVVRGQSRVMVVWHRAILPDGITVSLDSSGTDAIGRAGQGADKVDTHFMARFGEASLLSIISAGAANVGVSSHDQYNSASNYRSAIADSFSDSANTALEDSLPTQATLHIHQGARINVFVAKDINFSEVLGGAHA
ncbi:MAG: hypothetical protein CMF50_03755 [Legionellales bacterium]|nr:hypothetical protein [Legionellales bacterium]|tara:strand:+ start:14126 stop:15313 length:1188 start_codon:yes stop_codon:yes gene_type:complete